MNSKRLWRKKTGEYIRVGDMTDQHLLNTYKMLRRKNYRHSKNVLLKDVPGIQTSAGSDVIFDEAHRRGLLLDTIDYGDEEYNG